MLSIRTAGESDLALVAQMNARLIEDERSRNPMTLAELEQRARAWLTDKVWTIDFIERDGTVVGYALYKIRFDEYDTDRRVVYLRQFFVERGERGRGIGTEALALLTKTRFPPGAQVTVDILASNPQGERFWTKVGFTAYARTMVSRPASLRPPA